MIEVKLDGFHGNPHTLVRWEITATGIVVRLMPPLSDALMADNHKASPEEGLRHAARMLREYGADKVEVTPSCGCVYCDLDLEPSVDEHDGHVFHWLKTGKQAPCTKRNSLPTAQSVKS